MGPATAKLTVVVGNMVRDDAKSVGKIGGVLGAPFWGRVLDHQVDGLAADVMVPKTASLVTCPRQKIAIRRQCRSLPPRARRLGWSAGAAPAAPQPLKVASATTP